MSGLSKRAVQVGATRLELLIVVIVLAVVSGWLLHTIRFYQELTEKTVVESTIINLRSGLRFKIAELILKGDLDKQSSLTNSNPVQFVERPPSGYLGEMRQPGNLPPGSWYYEQDRAELVYIPNLTSHLVVIDDRQPASVSLRWQIKASGGEAGGAAVNVELLTPYNWF